MEHDPSVIVDSEDEHSPASQPQEQQEQQEPAEEEDAGESTEEDDAIPLGKVVRDLAKERLSSSTEAASSNEDSSSSSDSDEDEKFVSHKRAGFKKPTAAQERERHRGENYGERHPFYRRVSKQEHVHKVFSDLMMRVGAGDLNETSGQTAFQRLTAGLVSDKSPRLELSSCGPFHMAFRNGVLWLKTQASPVHKGLTPVLFEMDDVTPSQHVKEIRIEGAVNDNMHMPHGVLPVPVFSTLRLEHVRKFTLVNCIIVPEFFNGIIGSEALEELVMQNCLMIGQSELLGCRNLKVLDLCLSNFDPESCLMIYEAPRSGYPRMAEVSVLALRGGRRFFSPLKGGTNTIIRMGLLRTFRFESPVSWNLRHLTIEAHPFDWPDLFDPCGLPQTFPGVHSLTLNGPNAEVDAQMVLPSEYDINFTMTSPHNMFSRLCRHLNEHSTPVYFKTVMRAKFGAQVFAEEAVLTSLRAALGKWKTRVLALSPEMCLMLRVAGYRGVLTVPTEQKPTLTTMLEGAPSTTPFVPSVEFLFSFSNLDVLLVPLHGIINHGPGWLCKPTVAKVFRVCQGEWIPPSDEELAVTSAQYPENRLIGAPVKIAKVDMDVREDLVRFSAGSITIRGEEETDLRERDVLADMLQTLQSNNFLRPLLNLLAYVSRGAYVQLPPTAEELVNKKALQKYEALGKMMETRVYPKHARETTGGYISFMGFSLF